MFILKRSKDGKMVARGGAFFSYTHNIMYAQVFDTKEKAERSKCGNEYAVNIGYNHILERP